MSGLNLYVLRVKLKYVCQASVDAYGVSCEKLYELDSDIVWKEERRRDGFVVKVSYTVASPHCDKYEDIVNYYNLTIDAVPAKDDHDAFFSILDRVQDICKALTMMINSHNIVCREESQVRVYPDYSTLKIDFQRKCEPTAEEHNGHIEKIKLADNCFIAETVNITSNTSIDVSGFPKFLNIKSHDAKYICNQLYMAMGDEMLASKFFHLAAIIEFVEANYSNLSGAQEIFTKEQRKYTCQLVQSCLRRQKDFEKQKYTETELGAIVNILESGMSKKTDLGRNKKLKNILAQMGLKDIKIGFATYNIDENFCKSVTDCRNRYFHGADSIDKADRQKLNEIVVKLIWLCSGILNYVIQSEQNFNNTEVTEHD